MVSKKKNTFLTQSTANIANLIVSDPAVGIDSYGLTDRGKQQAKNVRVRVRVYSNRTFATLVDDHYLLANVVNFHCNIDVET